MYDGEQCSRACLDEVPAPLIATRNYWRRDLVQAGPTTLLLWLQVLAQGLRPQAGTGPIYCFTRELY